jgi:protoporphyrinogen oxidase
MPSVTIVGAGVAGLTIGYQLAQRGYAVTVVERTDVVGSVLGEEAVEIPRKSGVRMFGRFHEWPLRPSILLAMPFSLMFRGGKDLLFREHLEGESFEADVINKYGRTLYEIFFAPYTKKFLFYSAAELHPDWARAGVNRAVSDTRAHSDNLWSLLKNTLLPRPVDTVFLYPPHGVGRFSDLAAAEIERRGGRVLLGRHVTAVEAEGGRVRAVVAGDERLPCENLVWTGPITEIATHLNAPPVDLEFLSTIFYNFEIAKPDKFDFQWTYYGGDEIFSRVSAPAVFAKTMAPAGKSGLCVEMTCLRGDDRWQHPERLTDAVVEDLVRTGTIDSADDILGVHIEAVPNTYPIYKLNYLAQLTGTLRALGAYENLLLSGRSGRFWYNNMDHSIGQGLTMADKILKGDVLGTIDTADREFWADGEEDGEIAIREEEIAEPLEDEPGR